MNRSVGSDNPAAIDPKVIIVTAVYNQAGSLPDIVKQTLAVHHQVLVVDADNRLRFRQVVLLRLEHDDMLIKDGLEDGEMVCISPLQTVVDGMRVKPVVE